MKRIYFLLLLIVGCSPHVKESPPEFAFHKEWKEESMPTVIEKSTDKWWEIFGDQTLSYLVETGLENNPTLASSLARLEEAFCLADSAWAEQFPTLAANATTLRRRIAKDCRNQIQAPTGNLYQDPTLPQDPLGLTPTPVVMLPEMKNVRSPKFATDLLANLVLRYEIDLWGKRHLMHKASYKRAESTVADFEASRLILIDQIASAYFSFQADTQELKILEEEIRLLEDRISLFASEYQAGLNDQMSLLQEEEKLTIKKSAKEALSKSQKTNVHLLAILIGVEPSQFHITPETPSDSFQIVPTGLPSTLLAQRPDIRQIYKEAEALVAEIGIAKTELLPSISLLAGGGHESDKANRLFKWRNRIWDLSGSFKWLLFDMGSRRAQVRATQAHFRTIAASLTNQVLHAVEEVENALLAVKIQKERRSLSKKKKEIATDISQISKAQFDSGLVDYRSSLSSKEQELTAERELLRESTLLRLSTLTLIKSLGGSWE